MNRKGLLYKISKTFFRFISLRRLAVFMFTALCRNPVLYVHSPFGGSSSSCKLENDWVGNMR